MHGAKGLEWDAVAMIRFHDGHIPDFHATTQDEIDESSRLLYVGITRAKRFLLYMTDTANFRNVPTRFLGPDRLNLTPA